MKKKSGFYKRNSSIWKRMVSLGAVPRRSHIKGFDYLTIGETVFFLLDKRIKKIEKGMERRMSRLK
ncbi:MAG: hypothetical protein FJ241_12165 [Nitrospira sp.]|nr:hypothetical protein [Nitrospira sp.]